MLGLFFHLENPLWGLNFSECDNCIRIRLKKVV
jgi:hypothetical protein